MPKIIWSNDAKNNLSYYAKWYKKQNIQIIVHFKDIIKQCTNNIASNPYIYKASTIRENTRECVMQKFPFIIFYKIVSEQEVLITAFVHQSQNY